MMHMISELYKLKLAIVFKHELRVGIGLGNNIKIFFLKLISVELRTHIELGIMIKQLPLKKFEYTINYFRELICTSRSYKST